MILITGAAGFIGSAVAYALNSHGRTDLLLCDRFGKKEKWHNVIGLRYNRFIHRNDLFDFLKDKEHHRDIDAVIHLGACSDTTETDMDYLMQNNVDFSIKLCQWAREHDIRFVYASSGAVYGDGSLGFSDSDDVTPKLRPLNKYGFSKWMFDMWVIENGLVDKVAGLRFFNVFGPNEYHKGSMASVIFRVFPNALTTGAISLFESHRPEVAHGEQSRDFVYIDEINDIVLFVLNNPNINGIFNAGTGYAHTFNELAQSMFEALGKPKNIEYFPMPEALRKRYQYFTRADMTRLLNAGYQQNADRFQENVVKYVKQYLVSQYRYLTQA